MMWFAEGHLTLPGWPEADVAGSQTRKLGIRRRLFVYWTRMD
jgi:hypothetical protein